MPFNIALDQTRRLALCCALAWLTQGAFAQSVVRVSGTGSGIGGMRLLGQAFMQANPAVRIEVQPALGSTGGISALMAGHIELGGQQPSAEIR